MTERPHVPPRADVPDLEACLRLGINPNDPKSPRYGDRRPQKAEKPMGKPKKISTKDIHAGRSKPAKTKANGKSRANGKATRSDPVVRKRYELDLPVPISAAEAEKAGKAMAETINQRTSFLEERRDAMANLRHRGDAIDERLKELSEEFLHHRRKKKVKVEDRFIAETNTIEVVRLDTGEIVDRRAANAAERQEELFPGAPTIGDIAKTGADLGQLDEEVADLP